MPILALSATWEVRAGVIPGEPLPQFTRRFEYTSHDRDADEKGSSPAFHAKFSQLRAQAMDYYLQVSLPHLNNWATITFIWY